MNKEDIIIKLIEIVNDNLKIICKELNDLDTIDDYEIELDELNYTCCSDKKQQKNYKILVTCKRGLESQE